MRLIIKRDIKITDKEVDELTELFSASIEKHTGLKPTFYIEDHNYQHVDTETDSDGDKKPSKSYLTKLTDAIYKRYSEFGTDSIVLLVHEDNWIYSGIWGTNLSNIYHTYHVHLCRFDRDNMVNSFNTLMHEWGHSPDALIKTTIGVEIDTVVISYLRKEYAKDEKMMDYLDKNGFDWDRDYIHGGLAPTFPYIGRRATTFEGELLKVIAPYLKQSYAKRKDLHNESEKGLQMTVIKLLQSIVLLLRARNNRQNGVPRV